MMRPTVTPSKNVSRFGQLAAVALSAVVLIVAGVQPRQAAAQEARSGAAGASVTGDAPALSIELNTLSDSEAGCTASFVFHNALGETLSDASVEIVLFGTDGSIDKLLILKPGPLPVNKTRVTLFAFQETPCAGISRILVNTIDGCPDAAAVSPDANSAAAGLSCLERLKLSSRTSVPLLY